MTERGRQTARRIALGIYCGVIFLLSSLPDLGAVPWFLRWLPHPDKVAHFGMYGGLGLCALWMFRNEPREVLRRRAWGAAVVFAALYGVTDEVHQLFVPTRQFEIADMVADTLGALVFTGAVAGLERMRAERLSPGSAR